MKKTFDLKESTLRKRLLRLTAMGICAVMLATSVPSGAVTTAYAETVADETTDKTTDETTDEPTDEPADEPVVAQEQEITVKASNKKFTGDSIKKAKKTFKIGASAMTDISYKVMNGSKYVSVSKKGVVTVKKNTPAGTYKIKVTAEATEEYQEAATTVTVTVTKPTPEMKKAPITWDLKKNKAVKFSMDCMMATYSGDYYRDYKKKTGTVAVKKFKKVSKGNKYQLTFTLEYTLPTNFSQKEIDDIISSFDFYWGSGVQWFWGVYDYQTGKDLEKKNSYNVTVKSGDWKNSGEKKYYGSKGGWYSLPKTTSMDVTITYPKDYKDLCIVAGGWQNGDFPSDFNIMEGGKSYYHGMRVK